MCKNCSKTVRESGLDLECQTDVFTWPLRIRKEARRYFHSNRVISRSKSGKNPAQPPFLPLESSLPFQDRIGPPPRPPSLQDKSRCFIRFPVMKEKKGKGDFKESGGRQRAKFRRKETIESWRTIELAPLCSRFCD